MKEPGRQKMITVTPDQMAKVDSLAINKYKISLEQMMELAGLHLTNTVVDSISQDIKGSRVLVLVGKGNNGGGGLVAARHISNRGAKVKVLMADKEGVRDAVGTNLKTLARMKVDTETYKKGLELGPFFKRDIIIVDALLGYSLKGDPRPPYSDLIEMANRSGCPIISLDLPSGLDGKIGTAHVPCISAKATLTLGLPKRGLMVKAAKRYVGDLYLADIGLPPMLYREMGLRVGNLFKGRSRFLIK